MEFRETLDDPVRTRRIFACCLISLRRAPTPPKEMADALSIISAELRASHHAGLFGSCKIH
jgi:hypothetical protein